VYVTPSWIVAGTECLLSEIDELSQWYAFVESAKEDADSCDFLGASECVWLSLDGGHGTAVFSNIPVAINLTSGSRTTSNRIIVSICDRVVLYSVGRSKPRYHSSSTVLATVSYTIPRTIYDVF
jgi:hypothetical protein